MQQAYTIEVKVARGYGPAREVVRRVERVWAQAEAEARAIARERCWQAYTGIQSVEIAEVVGL